MILYFPFYINIKTVKMSVDSFKRQQKHLVEHEQQHRDFIEQSLRTIEMRLLYESSKTTHPNLEVVISDEVKALPFDVVKYKRLVDDLYGAIKHSRCKQKFLTAAYKLDLQNCIKYHKKLQNYEVDVIEKCNEGDTRVLTTDMTDEEMRKETGETERLMEASDELKKAYEYREKVLMFIKGR